MRILAIGFKNLNSLTGEWHIDFTQPDYASDGIFAITGPTGAGKTTILDAVCLGLYGRTPRLDKVTKSSNEIMSRQTGECFAEVTFETQKGRYRCHWSQRRARKRPDGELQPSKHEVADADTGTVLESRITQVSEFIEDATGMDFERFTRSMLLAQGGFAAFLKSSPDERAPILEQITGTGIYSQISIKVHERRAEERDELELLQAELKGMFILSQEEEDKLLISLQEKRSEGEGVGRQIENLRKAALWLKRVADLEKDIRNLNSQRQDWEAQRLAFGPETEKLERSSKALVLEGDYRGMAALRAQQLGDIKELDEALALLPSKEKACAEALAIRRVAETGLGEARTRQQAEGDVIKRVRDLDVQLKGLKRQVDESGKAIGEAEKQKKGYGEHLEDLGQSMKDAETELEAIHHYQMENSADAGLLMSLSAIARGCNALRELEAKHAKTHEELTASAGKRASALAASDKLEAGHKKSREELENKLKENRGLADEIASVQKGRDIGEWRQEAEALKDRQRLLEQTREIIGRMDKTSANLESLNNAIEILKAGHIKLLAEMKTISDQKAILEMDVGSLETQVSLLSRIRDLEEERKGLQDGNPCPLCGAIDHPYARGNIPELGDTEGLLKGARAEFKRVSEILATLQKEQVRTTTQIGHIEKEMEEKKAALDGDEKQCADSLLRLNIYATREERAGKVDEALADTRAKMAETAAIVASLDEKSKREKAAQKALEKIRVHLDESGKALEDARLKAESARLEHERLIKDSEGLAEEVKIARNAALRDVEPFGVEQIPPKGLEAIVKTLTIRKDAWQAKADKKIACEKKANDLKAEMDKERALLGKLERDLADSREERDRLKEEYGALNASRRELFGEKDADQEEKHLAHIVDQADKALDKAREEYGKIEREIGNLKGKIASLEEKTGNRATELAQAEQELMELIRKSGFEDEADYRSSCLGLEEREILAEKEKLLLNKKVELEARRKDRSEALARERERSLTDRPLETINEEISADESALKQLQEDMGAIKKSLGENEKLKEKQRESMKIIDAQKMECTRWDDLHLLIGSADGKKFRNFAQGLTFEMMIAHANRQLRKMTDRYLLIREASQPLELNVIDSYQAGEIRSTKNLSGGESFIVSLALALGLSQMASRNVRVDSLFLDEGFGSLDEDALETALETLAGLHQDGKLIGIISHVPALKERIGIQIQVIPQTGGRSVIEGPGCVRVMQN